MIYAEETQEGQAIIAAWEKIAQEKGALRNALRSRAEHLFLSVSQEDIKAQYNALTEEIATAHDAMVEQLLALHQRLNQAGGDTC